MFNLLFDIIATELMFIIILMLLHVFVKLCMWVADEWRHR